MINIIDHFITHIKEKLNHERKKQQMNSEIKNQLFIMENE